MVDFKEGKTEKSCESKGGKWTDHAHEAGGQKVISSVRRSQQRVATDLSRPRA